MGRIQVGADIYVEEGGRESPTLVLIHGHSSNGEAWNGLRPLVQNQWPGRWIVPDLRGHGRSGHCTPYAFATYASDIASLLGPEEETVLVGHSMGGAIAMVLASGWYGIKVRQVIAFGTKISWTEEELARRRQFAAQPVRWFEDRQAAIERYLKVAGLYGHIDPASPAAAIGIREENGRYRLANDIRINGRGENPYTRGIFEMAQPPVRLAVGSKDPMVSYDETRALDPDAVLFEGAGHNVHIERPDLVWDLIRRTVPLTR